MMNILSRRVLQTFAATVLLPFLLAASGCSQGQSAPTAGDVQKFQGSPISTEEKKRRQQAQQNAMRAANSRGNSASRPSASGQAPR